MQTTGSSLPVHYYAPLSQRSTIQNSYNILDQTETGHLNNSYPDFYQGTHDPTMNQYRAAARQRALYAVQSLQNNMNMPSQSYGNGATFNTEYNLPYGLQHIAQYSHLSPYNAAPPETYWINPQENNALRNDIRSDILNHIAKGNIHIHIEDEPEIIDMMDPINVHENAQIWGDPHFVGADGGKFDVQGEAGTIYNILSDQNIQLNAEFIAWDGGATVLGDAGITLEDDQVKIGKNGVVTINGTDYNDNGFYLNDRVEKQNNNIYVRSDEYDIHFLTKGNLMDIYFASENAVTDNILPQGLWGGTVDGDGLARNGDAGAGAQGGGGIMTLDGTIAPLGDMETIKDYELDHLFNTNFTKFNSFKG